MLSHNDRWHRSDRATEKKTRMKRLAALILVALLPAGKVKEANDKIHDARQKVNLVRAGDRHGRKSLSSDSAL
jgi:hypothetical protein